MERQSGQTLVSAGFCPTWWRQRRAAAPVSAPQTWRDSSEYNSPAIAIHWHQCGPSGCRGLFRGVAPPALLCHKEPARRIQSPLLGAFCLLLAGSLWHKGAYNRTFPWMEANYLYGIRDSGVATLRSSWPIKAKPRWALTNESGPHWLTFWSGKCGSPIIVTDWEDSNSDCECKSEL